MTLLIGDCIEQMRTLEADSVDAIVTDPPYGLEFMGKEWDGFGTPLGFQTWSEQWAREALRVLKPGGHLLAFGGTRMYHRLAAGIEDAGFEIRDTLMWLYGSGFPKSLDVSKAIDKAAGAEREVIGTRKLTGKARLVGGKNPNGIYQDYETATTLKESLDITVPSTPQAQQWQGWGTALKPAVEPIVLARKPLIGTVAANVLTHGTGALNIDASRIGTEQTVTSRNGNSGGNGAYGKDERVFERVNPPGRWPANILLDEEAAAMLDEQSGERPTGEVKPYIRDSDNRVVYNSGWGNDMKFEREASSGGASRFFYVAKASRSERNAGLERNIHPTVKPVALMKYLIRLVVPKGGTVLDPFLGSGTTAVAAIEEGVEWIGCEREPEYVEIIKARVAAAQPGMGLALEGER
jgi:site-specific DNA-methyltransferase (adenine-specific)